MTTSMSNGKITVQPLTVTGYAGGQDVRSVRHDLIGRADVGVSLAPAAPRTGTLELLFTTETDADTARRAFADVATWSLTDADRPTLPKAFVVQGGTLEHVLEDATRYLWMVRVPYLEI